MAKRLTDCEKWKKVWFRKLSPVHKCFWVYICDVCDHVGVWEVDFEMASLYIGSQLDEVEIRDFFKKQYIELNGGSKWLIKDFLCFQYGSMDENNRMFKTIDASLKKYGIKMGDIWGIYPRKVSVQVKDKVIVKDNTAIFPHLTDPVFKETFASFISGRKKKATEHAKELILKDLHKHDLKTAIAMLEQSIKGGWTGVFELRQGKTEYQQVRELEKSQKKPDPNCKLCGGSGKRYPKPDNKDMWISCNCWR